MHPTLTPLHSFTSLQVNGEKSSDFLQGQLTCDMRLLSQHGAASLAACCNHRGRMIANFWVIRWHDLFYIILPITLSDIVKNHLQKYAVLSKVSLSRDDHFFIAALDHYAGDNLAAISIRLPGEKRYLIIDEKNPYSDLPSHDDELAWKKNNIRDQLCILYPATSLLFTPQMIALEKLGGVSFDKGCYTGQEIIARTHYLGKSKRQLQQLSITSEKILKPGDAAQNSDGKIIGMIVEAIQIAKDRYDVLVVIQEI